MKKTIVLNAYCVQDADLALYVIEGDGVLNLYKDYNNALNSLNSYKSRGFEVEDHCA